MIMSNANFTWNKKTWLVTEKPVRLWNKWLQQYIHFTCLRMDGTKLQHIFGRHQQANDFSDSNFYDNGNLKQQIIEKIWKFKDNLKLLIKGSGGENQRTFREIHWFVFNVPPLTNGLKHFCLRNFLIIFFHTI